MLAELPLQGLRTARQMTQESLATVMVVRQAAVSEIRAVLPGCAVRISRFGAAGKVA